MIEQTKVIWGEECEAVDARVLSRDEKSGAFVALVRMPRGESWVGPFNFNAGDEAR